VNIESESENDSEIESEMDFGDNDTDDGSIHSSDGYISGSDSSDTSEKETAPTHSQPYRPPQLQPKGDMKLKKSINGIINRLCRTEFACISYSIIMC